jgi:hypothetical protein
MTMKAIAIKAGMLDSEIISESYSISIPGCTWISGSDIIDRGGVYG